MKAHAHQAGEMDVAQLTRRLAGREEDAFRQFHAIYVDRLYRYILAMTQGQEQAALDTLQDTFLRVVKHARPFTEEPVFWSWLTVLARSAVRDGGRRQRSYWNLLANYAASWFQAGSRSTPAHDPDPIEERMHEMLEHSLTSLEPLERALVEGKYVAGKSVRDLAAEFSLTEKAVESRLTRSRQHLRELLNHRWHHET